MWGVLQYRLFSKLPPPVAFYMIFHPFKSVILGLTTIPNLPLTPLNKKWCLSESMLEGVLS